MSNNYNEIIDKFMSYKYLELNQNLDNDTLEIFNNISFKKKKIIKKNNNFLKNNKIQSKKDTIYNKVNLILNKLTENNFFKLIEEFIDNINYINYNDFNQVLKTFYIKIINEINFIKLYLKFFKYIVYIYYKVYNYDFSYFINIIEIKFKYDYINKNIIDEENELFSFIISLTNENKQLNNLILINNLIDNNLLSDNIIEYCENILINQEIYFSDIYYWYNYKFNYKKINENDKININKIINNNFINFKDKVLLENLIQ